MSYPLLIVILLVLITIRAYIAYISPTLKGMIGEKGVSLRLNNLPNGYYVINDVLLNDGDNSSQIDHIVVSSYGIFVIETKNYKGWIFGGEDSEYWTQNIFRSKHKLYNPIKQNLSHVRKVKNLIKDYPTALVIPIVVFSCNSKLFVKGCRYHVVHTPDIRKTILSYNQICISDSQITEIYELINQNNLKDKADLKHHISSAKQKAERANVLIQMEICPKCGQRLVLRKGMYGKFYGCSNYPRCKFTMNL